MKNKIDILDERFNYIMDVVGEVDFVEISNKYKQLSLKDKFKTVCDVIFYLQKDISENDSMLFKEILKKCIYSSLNLFLKKLKF